MSPAHGQSKPWVCLRVSDMDYAPQLVQTHNGVELI